MARMCQGAAIEQDDERAAERMQAFPDFPGKKLASEKEINDRGADRKNNRDQTFQEQAGAETRGEQKSPEARVRFFVVKGAQKRPHGQGGGECEHDVWNQDAGEQEQADAGGDA